MSRLVSDCHSITQGYLWRGLGGSSIQTLSYPFRSSNDTRQRSLTPMALLIPATTGSTMGSTPLSQYHSLEPSPALATSALDSSASSSSVSLTAEDEGKHDHFANRLPCRLRPRGISRLLGTYVKRSAMRLITENTTITASRALLPRRKGKRKSQECVSATLVS